ncbi:MULTISPECIES: hypothetical protein [Cyanophyceae]|uniref:hypothetical protein n=1 Tax=Cyanophyceae TaxID=3028117 RepID=UPI001685C1A1|nr:MULTISPECIES: hypothetical protein [Cyanophyceae]MBD1919478.1 hypothetical protein [Phormidium sp. FACHB-77]MBD2054330.1 hypothetical protein [Leptolyngbya sp. FACHB-60]
MPLTTQEKELLNAQHNKTTQSKGGKGFSTPNAAVTDDSESDSLMTALSAHKDFEHIAQALMRSSDDRLNAFAGAVVENRKHQVVRFCDFLEKAEVGQLDLALIGAELKRRKERKAKEPAPPGAFDMNSPGFGINLDDVIDCTALITGFSTAKAIAGV